MKTIISVLFLCFATTVFAADVPAVNKKTIKAFELAFTEAKDAVWYAEENFDHVYFTLNNSKVRLKYDKEGNFVRSLRSYYETDLPLLIRIRIREAHGDKKIISVAELTTASDIEYHINLDDGKYIYAVKSDVSGTLSIEKKMRKG